MVRSFLLTIFFTFSLHMWMSRYSIMLKTHALRSSRSSFFLYIFVSALFFSISFLSNDWIFSCVMFFIGFRFSMSIEEINLNLSFKIYATHMNTYLPYSICIYCVFLYCFSVFIIGIGLIHTIVLCICLIVIGFEPSTSYRRKWVFFQKMIFPVAFIFPLPSDNVTNVKISLHGISVGYFGFFCFVLFFLLYVIIISRICAWD